MHPEVSNKLKRQGGEKEENSIYKPSLKKKKKTNILNDNLEEILPSLDRVLGVFLTSVLDGQSVPLPDSNQAAF